MQKKGSSRLLSVLSIVSIALGATLLLAYFIPFSFTGLAVYNPDALNLTLVDPTPSSGAAQESESVYINMSSDATLAYAWIEWNGTNESMSGSGTNWYITKEGNGTITYRAYGNDSTGNYSYTEQRTITLGMAVINITIPNQSVEEDGNFTALDLWNYTTSNKVDSELTYSILSETSTGTIDCSINGNRYMNCTVPANVSGSSAVQIAATYGSVNGNLTINITVLEVNDPPELTTFIPNKTIENNTTITIDMDDYFKDLESNSLNYTTTNPADLNFSFDIPSQDMNITAAAGASGLRNFTFIANDSQNITHSNMVYINITLEQVSQSSEVTGAAVEEVTVAEETFDIPDQEWLKNEDLVLDISAFLPEEILDASYSVEGLSEISSSFEGAVVTLTPAENWVGVETGTFKVTGPDMEYLSETTLTVKDKSNAPILKSEIPTIQFTENTTEVKVELSDYFEDPDGDELTYSVGEAISVDVSMETTSLVVFSLQDEPVEIANETVEISATDPTGLAVSDEVLVNIDSSFLKKPWPWLWIILIFVAVLGVISLLFVLKRRGQLHMPHLNLHLPKFRFRKLKDDKPKPLFERTQKETVQEIPSTPVSTVRTVRVPALRGGIAGMLSNLFAPREVRYAGRFRQEALYLRECIAIMNAIMSASEDNLAKAAMYKEKDKLVKAYNVLRQGLADTNIRKELLYLKEIRSSLIEIKSLSTDRLVREELSKITELLNKILKSFYNEQDDMAHVMHKSRRSRSASPKRPRKSKK